MPHGRAAACPAELFIAAHRCDGIPPMLCAPDEFVGPSNVHAFRSLLCHAPVPCFARRCDPCLMSEADGSSLVKANVHSEDVDQRQQDTILSWNEPETGIDHALSFQEPDGCIIELWEQSARCRAATRIGSRMRRSWASRSSRAADRAAGRARRQRHGRRRHASRRDRVGGAGGSARGAEAAHEEQAERAAAREELAQHAASPRAAPRTATTPTGPIWSARWHSSRRRRPACARL